jgi:hypothetical protein
VISQFSKKKLNFFFSFLSCSVALGFGVSGGIPQGNSRSFGIFFCWGRELRWESVFGPLISIRWMGAPLPNPSRPSLLLIVAAAPTFSTPLATPSLFLSSPWAAALYPLHGFLLPLDLPHAARIEKRRSTLN